MYHLARENLIKYTLTPSEISTFFLLLKELYSLPLSKKEEGGSGIDKEKSKGLTRLVGKEFLKCLLPSINGKKPSGLT